MEAVRTIPTFAVICFLTGVARPELILISVLLPTGMSNLERDFCSIRESSAFGSSRTMKHDRTTLGRNAFDTGKYERAWRATTASILSKQQLWTGDAT
jgi:hypothetical protein